jgi:cell wall-associated NlpC family hydrolase
LIGVYSSVGIPVPTVEEMGHFSHDWHLHTREDRYLHILSKYAEPVDVPLPGDICLFHLGRVYGHSGIVIDWPEIIHAHHTGGVQTCNALQDPLTLGRKVMFLSPWGKA